MRSQLVFMGEMVAMSAQWLVITAGKGYQNLSR